MEFTPEHDAVFEDELLHHFGGFSRLPGLVQGAWIGDGKVYSDQSRAYVVAVKSIVDAWKLVPTVDFAKRHYAQEAIYITYLGLSEIL